MLAYDWNFLGLSTETKPTAGEKVVDGSTFYECDTSTFFIFYQGEWYQQTFVTEDGINFWLYKTLMKKMFGKWFDSNITLAKIIKPTTGSEIEFINSLPAQITDLTGYGNTFQQTYRGKQLLPFTTLDITIQSINFKVIDGTLYINGTNAGGEIYSSNSNWKNNFAFTLPAGTYTLSYAGGDPGVYIKKASDDTNLAGINRGASVTTDTFTLAESTAVYLGLYLYHPSFNNKKIEVQLESGSATSYEPYVGGTASPNPDYPQDIQTVTGEQTVTINGEQVYTIDLGTIELCKIGNYQDYIYKNGDDWYVHKAVGKSLLGDLTWAHDATNQTGVYRMRTTDLSGMFIAPATIRDNVLGFSNYFSMVPSASTGTYGAHEGLSANPNGESVQVYNSNYNTSSSASAFTTWAQNNNVVFYYTLATPTDTKITDNTLIGNLNALLNYIFPAGDHQIVITADGLPMALKLTITEKE